MTSVLVAVSVLLMAGNGANDPCANPQWTTIDDFILPGTTDAAASAVTVHKGEVWVAGMSGDVLSGHWVVRKQDSSGNFSTVDDFIYSIGLRNQPNAFVRSGESMFVVGGENNSGNGGQWLVRETHNGGQTWTLSDEFTPATNSIAAHAFAATRDASGALLVSGYGNVNAEGYHWYTRRSTDLGVTWATVDDQSPLRTSTGARGSAIDTTGTVFVSGYNFDGYQYRWQTRRSIGTGPWALVDDWTQVTDAFADLNGLSYGSDPASVATGKQAGVVLVAGTSYEGDKHAHWIVRRSLDNGATWSVVDDLVNCGARGIAFDKKSQDGFYAVGRCPVAGGYEWVTRHSDATGASWTTDDTYAFSSAGSSYPNAISVGHDGSTYAAGLANDGTHSHWIVRQRLCISTTSNFRAPIMRR